MAATEVTGAGLPPRPGKDAEIASLTGMRGFAAIVVVMVHVAFWTDFPWFGLHGYGPIALFVLSGFLLYRPYARWLMGGAAQPSTRAFAVRRLTRIFPPYLVVIFMWMFIYPAAVPQDGNGWFHTLTMTGVFDILTLPNGLAQVWSMGTELSWYFALPLLVAVGHLLTRGRSPRTGFVVHATLIATSVPATVAWMWWCHQEEKWQELLWLPGHFVCFAAGAFVALLLEAQALGVVRLERVQRVASGRVVMPLLGLALLGLAVSHWAGPIDLSETATFREDLVRRFSCTGLAVVLLLISVYGDARNLVVRFMSTRWMQATGRWSYGIYLCHMPVIVMLEADMSYPDGASGLVQRLLWTIPISWALGAAMYAWVELPTMSAARRFVATLNTPTGGSRRSGGARVAERSGR